MSLNGFELLMEFSRLLLPIATGDFKDKVCNEVYSFKALCKDAFDRKKYVIPLIKICIISFDMLEDNRYEDQQVEIPIDEESSDLSDEVEKMEKATSSMDDLASTIETNEGT